jgi:hypothetical protein
VGDGQAGLAVADQARGDLADGGDELEAGPGETRRASRRSARRAAGRALAAIAGSAGCWIAGLYLVPEMLQVLSASVFMLAGASLIASPARATPAAGLARTKGTPVT